MGNQRAEWRNISSDTGKNQCAGCGIVKARCDSALNGHSSCIDGEVDGLQGCLEGKICRITLFIGGGVKGEG